MLRTFASILTLVAALTASACSDNNNNNNNGSNTGSQELGASSDLRQSTTDDDGGGQQCANPPASKCTTPCGVGTVCCGEPTHMLDADGGTITSYSCLTPTGGCCPAFP